MILLDTSALYALASARDENHSEARRLLRRIEDEGENLLLHSYVLLETFALVHRRHGLPPAERISAQTAGLPMVLVDRPLHDRSVEWLRRRRGAGISLVDAVSFVVMAERNIEAAFAFDEDFVAAGYQLFGR